MKRPGWGDCLLVVSGVEMPEAARLNSTRLNEHVNVGLNRPGNGDCLFS